MADVRLGREAGKLLRKLRMERRFDGHPLTMKDVSDLSGVSRDIISQLENGKRDWLKREKLDLIVGVLEDSTPVPFADRRVLLQAFGYDAGNGLPTDADVARAVEAWASWKAKPYPVYLTDYAFRIHDWNDMVPRFLGLAPHESGALKTLTVIDLAFGEALAGRGVSIEVVNGETYLRTWIEDMKTELSRYEGDAWHGEFISVHGRKYPAFKCLWESVLARKAYAWEPKLLPPVSLSFNGSEPIQFRVSGPELATDHRFRIIEYNPSDQETFNRCFALLAEADRG
jgi:transcriptional regulator with XRE-family HTH domain